MIRAFRTVIGLLLLGAAVPAHADDWPMLGGRPDRNLVSSEKGLPTVFAADKEQKNIKWMAVLGHYAYGTPVVSGGRVYVGTSIDPPRDAPNKESQGVLLCLSESDGKVLWQGIHEKLPDTELFGVCSTPCVVGDQLFYVSNRAELVCRTAKDGKVVWILDMIKELDITLNYAVASSPLVVGDLVFVLTGQGRHLKKNVVMNPKAPSFIAVNRLTGKVVWTDNSPGSKILAGQWSSPAYSVIEGQAQVVFPGGDGWLYSFEPESGKLLWKFNCKAHEKLDKEGSPETPNQLVATPVISGHRVIIATGIDTDTNGPGCIRAVDARKRGDVTKTAELWRLGEDQFACSLSMVAVNDGLVYALQYPGFVDCIDLETGKRLWQHDALSTTWGSPLVADGKLYVRTADDEVLVFQTGREKKLLAKNSMANLGTGPVVAANGVLYLSGHNKIYAVAESK